MAAFTYPAWAWLHPHFGFPFHRVGERIGIRICEAMTRRGVLTRPIGNVIILMPPYCTTPKQLKQMVSALAESISEVLKRT